VSSQPRATSAQRRIIENPVSGERIVIRTTAGESGGRRVSWELFLAPGGRVPSSHAHPEQEERKNGHSQGSRRPGISDETAWRLRGALHRVVGPCSPGALGPRVAAVLRWMPTKSATTATGMAVARGRRHV
jgi:hypothetical protein